MGSGQVSEAGAGELLGRARATGDEVFKDSRLVVNPEPTDGEEYWN